MIAVFFLLSCAVKLQAVEVNIDAEILEYDDEAKYMVATDSVTVTWKDKTLVADKVEFWTEKEYLVATGNVCVSDETSIMFGQDAVVDYRNDKGEINFASGYFEPWFFSTRKAEQLDKKRVKTSKIYMTTCDYDKPHYSVRSKSAKIVTNKRITLFHPVFYIRSVPVFYFPIWTQGLGSSFYDIEIQPGYNDIDGYFAKSIVTFTTSGNSRTKLYLDYFNKRGWGKGAQFDYFETDKFNGTIYGYNIKEDRTRNEYWTFSAGHWNRIDKYWTSRSDVNFVNNTTFNKLYFQDNYRTLSRSINSNLSLNRQSPRSSLTAVFGRYDVYNTDTNEFEPETITAPSLNYILYNIFQGAPFTSRFETIFKNEYKNSEDVFRKSGFVGLTISQSYNVIRRKLTYSPSLGLAENWQDRVSLDDMTNLFVTRYALTNNFRYFLMRNVIWDMGHGYTLRSEQNRFAVDYENTDYGEERNEVYFKNQVFFRRVNIKNSISYNLHLDRGEALGDWRRKLTPLVNEALWYPLHYMSVFLREESEFYPEHKVKTVQTMIGLGDIEKHYLNLGAFYNCLTPNDLSFSIGFGVWPTRKWRVQYQTSFAALDNFDEYRFSDQELQVYRDLHCWETKVTYRRRMIIEDGIEKPAEEVYLLLGLKANFQRAKKSKLNKVEKDYYPWRK
ncbi:MAG: hypothetical protein JW803_09170 [Endomicrobiales bacterium]|nr:hypothetical protein [Endomicrobiales bacterium]